MFRSLFLFRRFLATSFLLVFVNVFVGQCYCASLGPVVLEASIPVAKITPAPKPSHPGCQGHSKAIAKQEPAKAQYGHDATSNKSSEKSDCCKDNSAAILKSLTTPAQKQVFILAPALLPEAMAFHFRPAAGQWNQASAVTLVLREHLPPKIPDIRIFIQSLTV